MKTFVSRPTFFLATVCLLSAWSVTAQARFFSVFEVKKNLRLSNQDPVYKDFYIDAGYKEGLRKGMIIDVVRHLPVHDGFKNQAKGNLHLTVAKVKIIHTEKHLAVARSLAHTTDEKRPIAEFNTVMIGDAIDMSTALVQIKKNPRKLSERRKRGRRARRPAQQPREPRLKEPQKKAPLPQKPTPTHAFHGPPVMMKGEVPSAQ